MSYKFIHGLALAVAAVALPAMADSTSAVELRKAPAWRTSVPQSTAILGATRAGHRVVGVGARGMVLLSDDDGHAWRQAATVPVRTTLTAVDFVNDHDGWAVGHDGTILHTSDGGEHWTLQRFDASVDQPLFSVKFLDTSHGLAVGLWSLLLTTADGGQTWKPVKLDPPPGASKADRNLFCAFADSAGHLFIAAEKGTVLRSDDRGATWSYGDTGYKGSLWTGVSLADGSLLVAGLRGNMLRSRDGGKSWETVTGGSTGSITDLVADGRLVVGVGLDGTVITSSDGGATFAPSQRSDRAALTAVVPTSTGNWQMFSEQGVVGH